MLDFNVLLREAGIGPDDVALIRHQPVEPSLRRVLPWLVVDQPDLFLAWQQVQWRAAERMMSRAQIVAAFIGQEAGCATFAGLSRVGSWRHIDYEGYLSFPGNAELMQLGMTGMKPSDPHPIAFELEPLDVMQPWIGKLIVSWPKPERVWCRWAARGSFPVRAILEESRFERAMPRWDELVLTWSEIAALPKGWRSALAEWRGVYFIFDRKRRAGYVGSAYGGDNILGRWREYSRTGHGGNKQLRLSDPHDLTFSILQRTSPDLPSEEIVAIESSWKDRLHTRRYGLNDN